MKKIIDFFCASDKQLHIMASYIATTVIFLFFSHWNPELAVLLGFVGGASAGIGKEAYDAKHPDTHDADVLDLAADFIGVFIALFFMLFSIC